MENMKIMFKVSLLTLLTQSFVLCKGANIFCKRSNGKREPIQLPHFQKYLFFLRRYEYGYTSMIYIIRDVYAYSRLGHYSVHVEILKIYSLLVI